MPAFNNIAPFLQAMYLHAHRPGQHTESMLSADSGASFGYSCALCEQHFSIRMTAVREARGQYTEERLDFLADFLGNRQGRVEFPLAIQRGDFNDFFTEEVLGRLQPQEWYDYEGNDLVRAEQARMAGVRTRTEPRPLRFGVTSEPATAPAVQVERYRRRPETVEAFTIPENGWYDVTGMGVTWLEAGFYLWSEMGLTTRETQVFHEQYELIPQEDPNIVLGVGTPRHERDIEL